MLKCFEQSSESSFQNYQNGQFVSSDISSSDDDDEGNVVGGGVGEAEVRLPSNVITVKPGIKV